MYPTGSQRLGFRFGLKLDGWAGFSGLSDTSRPEVVLLATIDVYRAIQDIYYCTREAYGVTAKGCSHSSRISSSDGPAYPGEVLDEFAVVFKSRFSFLQNQRNRCMHSCTWFEKTRESISRWKLELKSHPVYRSALETRLNGSARCTEVRGVTVPVTTCGGILNELCQATNSMLAHPLFFLSFPGCGVRYIKRSTNSDGFKTFCSIGSLCNECARIRCPGLLLLLFVFFNDLTPAGICGFEFPSGSGFQGY